MPWDLTVEVKSLEARHKERLFLLDLPDHDFLNCGAESD
jgi:hypothetical protein